MPKKKPPPSIEDLNSKLDSALLTLKYLEQSCDRERASLVALKSSVDKIVAEIPIRSPEPPLCEDCAYFKMTYVSPTSKGGACLHPASRKADEDGNAAALVSRQFAPSAGWSRSKYMPCGHDGALFERAAVQADVRADEIPAPKMSRSKLWQIFGKAGGK